MSALPKTKITHISARALPKAVDQLGVLLAQIADLEAQATNIKAEIKRSGLDIIEGKAFRAVVVEATRKQLAKADVVAELGQDWVDEHSDLIQVTSVKVTSR